MLKRIRNPLNREERLQQVRDYLRALGLKDYRAIVFGSVARGDFIAESDTDLLIISDELPQSLRERLDVLFRAIDQAPEVEPIGWREQDWERRKREGDPFIELVQREGLDVRH